MNHHTRHDTATGAAALHGCHRDHGQLPWLLLLPCLLLAVACPGQEPAPSPAPTAEAAAGSRFVSGNANPGTTATASRSKRQAHVDLDESTRTLFVTTDPVSNEQVMQVIRALDKPAPQALIKVLFLEVTHSNDLDLGLEATYTHTSSNGNNTSVGSVFGLASQTDGGIAKVLQNDLEVTLRALAKEGKLNVRSRPSILARNNQEATITIGQEVPFITNSRITTDGQTINTVEYRDIGIILTVTPHIGSDGLIELDVAPEISTVTGDSVKISDTVTAPVFAKRSANTHVIVPSGKTAVIGGLMDDQETVTIKKLPLLGDIPVLGALFRRKITNKTKTELLIFLTPTLVDSGRSMAAMTSREQQRNELTSPESGRATLQKYLEDAPLPEVKKP